MPAVSLEDFEEKVVHSPNASEEREDSSTQEICDVCRKVFYSRHAFQGHLRGHHHVRNLAAEDDAGKLVSQNTLVSEMNTASLYDSVDLSTGKTPETAEEEFDAFSCLFCTVVSSDMEDNLAHMQRIHGLFIPDQEHLIDMESFLGYLFTIISEFQECLYCSITKNTVEAIQHHMKDKGHCKLKIEQGSEWQLFYELSDSESDAETPKRHTTTSTDDELHLPSGKILGHRSQPRHHHPNAPTRASSSQLTAPKPAEPATPAAAVAASPNPATTEERVDRRTNQQLTVRTGDRLGMIGVPAAQQRALRAVEKMMLKRESRARDAYQAGVQKAGNRQKHFKVCALPGRLIFFVDEKVLSLVA